MKTLCLALFTGIMAVVLAAALDLTGKWALEANFDDSSTPGGGFDCAFKQDGEQLSGTCANGAAPVIGELKGRNVTWKMKAGGTQETIIYTGMVDDAGTSIKGRFAMAAKGGTFTASKR
jgi:hypothetical protein